MSEYEVVISRGASFSHRAWVSGYPLAIVLGGRVMIVDLTKPLKCIKAVVQYLNDVSDRNQIIRLFE